MKPYKKLNKKTDEIYFVMKIVIQRVLRASVTIGGEPISSIGHGLMILVGVVEGDSLEDMEWLAQKA